MAIIITNQLEALPVGQPSLRRCGPSEKFPPRGGLRRWRRLPAGKLLTLRRFSSGAAGEEIGCALELDGVDSSAPTVPAPGLLTGENKETRLTFPGEGP